MSVRIQFLGSGGAFSDGGRCQACIHVSAPGVSLLLDCGGTALPALKRGGLLDHLDAIAITHLHGDHFGGLPYLLLEQHYAGRTRPLTIAGPRELADRSDRAGRALFADFFGRTPLRFPLRILPFDGSELELGGARVSAIPVKHVPESDPHGLRVHVAGTLIAYSGDATWSESIVPLAAGADLFICDGMSFDGDDAVHMSYRTLMAHRGELDCRRIVLTHLGANAIARLDEIELEHAEDGMVLEL